MYKSISRIFKPLSEQFKVADKKAEIFSKEKIDKQCEEIDACKESAIFDKTTLQGLVAPIVHSGE